MKTGKDNSSTITINHTDLWGTRKYKYSWLKKHDVTNTHWTTTTPNPPFYLFVPQNESEMEQYNTFPSVTEIFEQYSAGIVTARDKLTIHWTPEDVWTTVLNFSQMEPEMARQIYPLGKDAHGWKVTLAQQDIRESGPSRDKVVPILYRPFDVRYTYYTGRANGFHERPRAEVIQNMLTRENENVALITVRQVAEGVFNHAFVTTQIVESRITLSNKGIAFIFPLYIYPNGQHDWLANMEPQDERQANIKSRVFEWLAETYSQTPTPEDVFHYIYAVLYAPSYREKYADFLRLDFPRIPFPQKQNVFDNMSHLGKRLVSLHRLVSTEIDEPLTIFEGKGDGVVAKPRFLRYVPETERVYINENQYFAPVPREVWKYTIGGYQVCYKWLKDRKERKLTFDEIATYCRIVTALKHTIDIQDEIDKIYSQMESIPLGF